MTDTTTTVEQFSVRLVRARRAYAQAVASTRPLDQGTIDRMIERVGQAKYDELAALVTGVVATIPALRDEVAELEAQACSRCTGSGEYGGASRYVRGGRKFCFACGGSGIRRN